MTIIIETPQPPVRERLVLVREGEPMAPRRDAEPADLERAGWVEEHLLVTARAEMRELGSERDEARAEAAKLDAKLAQAEERGDLADQRAIDAIAERDEALRERDAEIASRDALARVLEQVERERDEARSALATMTRQRDDALQVLGQAREALPSDMRDGWLVDAVRRLVRERDEARQQRDNLRGNYGDVCALVASAKRILGATEDEDIEQVAERVTRERDEVRLILDASAGETTADAATRLHNDWVDARERADRVERERAVDAISGRARAAIVERERAAGIEHVTDGRAPEPGPVDAVVDAIRGLERERDEARCLHEAAHCERMRITDVLQRVERERDEARAALATMTRQRDDATALAARLRCDLDRATDREDGLAAERARCVAWLRAEAASSDWASCATWGRALSDTADRLERGDHAGTPAPAALPRATDEELFALAHHAMELRQGVTGAALAVAARVRREQCLVTSAVEAGADLRIITMRDGTRDVSIVSHGDKTHAARVPAADVPATLARLLGEVARGR